MCFVIRMLLFLREDMGSYCVLVGFGKELFWYTDKNGTRWKFSVLLVVMQSFLIIMFLVILIERNFEKRY